MLFFSNQAVPQGWLRDDKNGEQFKKLQEFREKMTGKGLYEDYDNIESLKQKLFTQLCSIIDEEEYFKEELICEGTRLL
jgi:hypothetical protein